MAPKEFLTLVAAMREAQKKYFCNTGASRQWLLKKAKELEKQVDEAIKEQTQPRLF